jgi:hypothetical protein
MEEIGKLFITKDEFKEEEEERESISRTTQFY